MYCWSETPVLVISPLLVDERAQAMLRMLAHRSELEVGQFMWSSCVGSWAILDMLNHLLSLGPMAPLVIFGPPRRSWCHMVCVQTEPHELEYSNMGSLTFRSPI
jgi:hypothetical protein